MKIHRWFSTTHSFYLIVYDVVTLQVDVNFSLVPIIGPIIVLFQKVIVTFGHEYSFDPLARSYFIVKISTGMLKLALFRKSSTMVCYVRTYYAIMSKRYA